MVTPEKMGEILGCDADTVMELAAEMGLQTPPRVELSWLQKGYITIIRANWQLCTYEQIAALLDWDIDRLAYILREDDFLSIKLGDFKPDVPPVAYAPLTEDERLATANIRRVVKAALEKLPSTQKAPFDFCPMFSSLGQYEYPEFSCQENTRFDHRIIYSYCALYGDTFADRTLIDESFPDELLAAYQSLGITGVWTQAVLYKLVPFPFDPAISEGFENRHAGMRYLIEKLAKYNLKLFLYFNEPRAMPISFFERYPQLKGHESSDGYASMCVSVEEVQSYLYNGSRQLNEAVPGIGGYVTITASENWTNCYSHTNRETCNCPRCKERMPSDVIADVNRLLYEGAVSVNPNIDIVAWNWGWIYKGTDTVHKVIEKMPESIALMCVSEEDVSKNIGGFKTSVRDYSISVEGPGAYALDTWDHAHKNGHPAYAKLQLGVTWEISIVPCVPVFEKTWRHLCGIIEKGRVDGIMLGWTLGGFPSPTLRFAQGFYADHERLPTLEELYTFMFPGADVCKLTHAFHLLSLAYDAYPFNIMAAYYGPQQVGPANLLYPTKTGYSATMTGMPYDDLNAWRGSFPTDIYIKQIKKMSDEWHIGALALASAVQDTEDERLAAVLRWTRVVDAHFRSMYNQCIFVQNRDEGVIDRAIVANEVELAEALLLLSAEDPMIGYESANHYFYHRNHLLEKLVNCDWLLHSKK